MPIAHFERKIQELNFSFISEKGTSGVLLTQNYESLSKAISAPDILFALETAKNKFGADAVYFRYFQDSRAAVPQLYIFDYTLKPLSSQQKNTERTQEYDSIPLRWVKSQRYQPRSYREQRKLPGWWQFTHGRCRPTDEKNGYGYPNGKNCHQGPGFRKNG